MAASKSRLKLAVRPLTPDRWPALEDLFGRSAACGGCWCMHWRIGSAYHKRPPAEQGSVPRGRCRSGRSPASSCARAIAGSRRDVRAHSGGVESGPARESSGPRSLSARREADAERFGNRLCLDLRARRIQDTRAPCAAASDHAPRSHGEVAPRFRRSSTGSGRHIPYTGAPSAWPSRAPAWRRAASGAEGRARPRRRECRARRGRRCGDARLSR
jgi:hypothetical protein